MWAAGSRQPGPRCPAGGRPDRALRVGVGRRGQGAAGVGGRARGVGGGAACRRQRAGPGLHRRGQRFARAVVDRVASLGRTPRSAPGRGSTGQLRVRLAGMVEYPLDSTTPQQQAAVRGGHRPARAYRGLRRAPVGHPGRCRPTPRRPHRTRQPARQPGRRGAAGRMEGPGRPAVRHRPGGPRRGTRTRRSRFSCRAARRTPPPRRARCCGSAGRRARRPPPASGP